MLKVGVIGAGHLGETHIKLLKGINDFELVGFYDSDETYKDNVASSLSVKSFNDVEELIDMVDVVDIVKPSISHFDYAVNAIKQSKHVLDNMSDWCVEHHGKSGLTARCLESTISIEQASIDTIAFLAKHVDKGASPMCGNSIGQDRRFITKYMSEFEQYFSF